MQQLIILFVTIVLIILQPSYYCMPLNLEETSSIGSILTGEKSVPKAIILHDGIQPLEQLFDELKIQTEGRKKGTEWFLANSKALINAGLLIDDATDVIQEGKDPFLRIFAIPLSFLLSAFGLPAAADILSGFGISSLTSLLFG